MFATELKNAGKTSQTQKEKRKVQKNNKDVWWYSMEEYIATMEEEIAHLCTCISE